MWARSMRRLLPVPAGEGPARVRRHPCRRARRPSPMRASSGSAMRCWRQRSSAAISWWRSAAACGGSRGLRRGGGSPGRALRPGADHPAVPGRFLGRRQDGINSPHGKNLVGAFHQPSLVLADTALLDTLPLREMRAGYAEVVKYGLIGDAAFFDWCEANWQGRVRRRIARATRPWRPAAAPRPP